MATETTTETNEAPVTTAEATPAEAPLPSGGEAAAPVAKESAPPPAGGETQAATYSPNFKYKASGQDKEVPEWARPIVKDAASEKQLRELFEKADGLDPVKASRQEIATKLDNFEKNILPFAKDAQEALLHAQRGDLDSFFEKVGITEKQVLQYALMRIKLREKPEALAAHEEARKVQLENLRLKGELENYSRASAESMVTARENELGTAMARPEVAAAVQQFNQQNGPGAFRNKCIERGQLYAANKIDAPVDTIVNEVMRLFVGPVSLPNGVAATGVKPHVPPATLPNIRGNGTSPVKKIPRSTEELRQLGREKRALEG